MSKQAIIDKIAQELKLFNKPVLQEALDYIEYLREKYFADQLTEEELKEIELSRKEIQDGKYVTLEELEQRVRH
jgi:hypothetical protein